MTLAIAAASVVSIGGCGGNPTGPDGNLPFPAEIQSCETNTARLCTTWERAGDIYHATWSNGSTAEIEVIRFGEDVISFERRDTGGPTSDMHAFYYGIPRDGTITDGVVVWNTGGSTFAGRWEATW